MKKLFTLDRLVLFVACLIFCAALWSPLNNFRVFAGQALRFAYPLTYAEGTTLDQSVRLSQGQTLYQTDLSQAPYTLTTQPPLFMALQALLVRVFGPAFWYGRLLSIISLFAVMVLIGLAIWRITGEWLPALLGGASALFFPQAFTYAALNTADLFSVALAWAGLYIVIDREDEIWPGWLAAAFFIAAGAARFDSLFVALLAGCVWLLARQKARAAARLAIVTLFSAAALFIALNLATRGGFFLHTVQSYFILFSAEQLTGYLIEYWMYTFFLLVIVFIYLIAERLGRPTQAWPLALTLVLASFAPMLLSGFNLAGKNYFLFTCTALCFTIGAVVSWPRTVWVKAVLVGVVALQFFGYAGWTEQYLAIMKEKTASVKEYQALEQTLQSTPGAVLADENLGMLTLAHRTVLYQPVEFAALYRAGRWDARGLLESIHSREFAAILMYNPPQWAASIDRWPDEIRWTIRDEYDIPETLAYNWIFIPKPAP